MTIRELLTVDANEDIFPVTNALQTRVIEILSDESATPGDSPLIAALALSVLELETQSISIRSELHAANTERLLVQQRLVDLETRILNAGIRLGASELWGLSE